MASRSEILSRDGVIPEKGYFGAFRGCCTRCTS
jgi:hypothetical protein